MKIFWLILIFANNFSVNGNENIEKNLSELKNTSYDNIFNSIESDSYNLSLIYNYSYNQFYNTIKIKHKSKNYKSNKILCILGVLANENGITISNIMLEWLIPEYDVYCVYQKYPGVLYEYPALRFAQWFALKHKKPITLYIHTKGAFNNNSFQNTVREVWKHEFTRPYSKIYTKLIENNITDISLPFRSSHCTWYNGMFISYRAFNSIKDIPYYKDILRHYYECLTFLNLKYLNTKIRFKGVLFDCISSPQVVGITPLLARYFRLTKHLEVNKQKDYNIFFFLLILMFVFFLKIIINFKLRFYKINSK